MVDYLQKVKIGNSANTRKTYTSSKSSKITVPVACQATGFDRELLPVPVSYYEAQGLTLQGSRGAEWKTTECRFHGGSDSLRIKVTTGAFVCMACGAKGGDVLAYEMATHGIGFIDAAKQLGAWASVYAGAKVIRDEARARAPKAAQSLGPKQPPPGTLKRSVIMKHVRELSGGGRQTFYVLVRHGKKYRNQGKRGNLSQDAWYWRFLEFGTRKMSARPFLRPALESRRREAVNAIKDRLAQRIEIETKDLNRG